MSDAPLQVGSNSDFIPLVPLGEFHALLNNKFEAAFTSGRAINYINFTHNLGMALGSPINHIQLLPIFELLQASCFALELPVQQSLSVKAAVSPLPASLIPTDDAMENSQYRAELVGVWLEDSQATEPLDTRLSLLESTTANPLKSLLDTITSPPSTLSEWIFLGLKIDQIFRPLGLAGRIRKQRNANDVFELHVMNDFDFFGVEHRNKMINAAFSRMLPPQTLVIESNSRENDQLCESMIATSIRALCQRDAEREGILGFVKLWLAEVKGSILKRDGVQTDIGTPADKVVRRLLEARKEVENGTRSNLTEQMIEKSLFEMDIKEVYKIKRVNQFVSVINLKLFQLGLRIVNLKRVVDGIKETGRCIVDIRNLEERKAAEEHASLKSFKWRTEEEVESSIAKRKGNPVSK